MTKEEAIEILEEYFNSQADFQLRRGLLVNITIPKVDENISKTIYDDGLNHVFEQWSFKGLVKLIYDLEDKH